VLVDKKCIDIAKYVDYKEKNNEKIGAVEFILDLKSVISDMKKFDSSILVLVDKKCIDIAKYVDYKENIGNYVICQKSDEIDRNLIGLCSYRKGYRISRNGCCPRKKCIY